MSAEQERHAAQLLARARRGELGQDGIDMVARYREHQPQKIVVRKPAKPIVTHRTSPPIGILE